MRQVTFWLALVTAGLSAAPLAAQGLLDKVDLTSVEMTEAEITRAEVEARLAAASTDAPADFREGRILRGGNWFNEPFRAGSPTRIGADPTHRMSLIGFRVVMEGA